MADSNDNMVMDISIPEAKTLQTHLASADPHPQYLLRTSIVGAIENNVKLGDLLDVNITGIELSGKVLALSGATWIPTAVSDLIGSSEIPKADTETYGTVKYATYTDVEAGNNALAVDPIVMKQFVSNYIIDTKAGPAAQGTVRLVTTNDELASKIYANDISAVVEQIVSTLYVQASGSDGVSNFKAVVCTPVGNIQNVDNFVNAKYNVYDRGILSGYVNSTNIDASINVYSGGHMYDAVICNQIEVHENATAKRITLRMTEAAEAADNKVIPVDNLYSARANTYIRGSVESLYCGGTKWLKNPSNSYGAGCAATVYDHGHLAYATVEHTGEISCRGGIIEHVMVRNTTSNDFVPNHFALVIDENGKGYDITLQGSAAIVDGVVSSAYARASIQGYAEDVKVFSGCHLDIQSDTAMVRNLTVYNGGYVTMTDGAKIEGLVLYPGATISKTLDCTIIAVAHCHEPDKKVVPVYEVNTVISTPEGASSAIEARTYKLSPTEEVTDLTYGEALLLKGTEFITSMFSLTSNVWKTTSYTETSNMIDLYSVDAPRLIRRTDSEQLESAAAAGDDWPLYSACMSSAFRYYDAEILVCNNLDELNPKHYVIAAPEEMYDDIYHSAATVLWEVIF